MFSTQQITADQPKTKPVFFQPKHSVNQPGDVYEQEADQIADTVMRTADNSLSQAPFFKPVNYTDGQSFIQRKGEGNTESQEGNESPSGEASGLESALLCSYYADKFWLSDEEKDQQLYDRILDHFSDQRDAHSHLYWYRYGNGQDYNENIDGLFDDNPSVQKSIAIQIGQSISATNKKGSLIGDTIYSAPIKQGDYDSDNWLNANGNIDRVDWELIGDYTPHAYNQFKISIRDPYTWHPLEDRPTQCIHEAMVRLQKYGAQDYITVGSSSKILLFIP